MKLIVNVSEDWGIGSGGDLLFPIPEDMKFFRTATLNSVVVMGRKTLESFPGGNPLKNRTNIVLTRNTGFIKQGAEIYHDKESVLKRLENEQNVFIIGGAEVYKMFLEDCDEAYVTKVHSVKQADAYFPDLDKDKNWKCIEISDTKEYNGIRYNFCKYVRCTEDAHA